MKKLVFLFDLDGTLTAEETLPRIAKEFHVSEEMALLTDETIKGNVPFIDSFIRRVDILKKIPLSSIKNNLKEVSLLEHVVGFIRENINDCHIVTGNLNEWVSELVKKIGCNSYSSEGMIKDDELIKLTKILKKEDVVKYYKKQNYTVVFVGDGHNDSEAMRYADISIACGIVHYPAKTVLSVADYAVFSEVALVRILNQIKAPKSGKSVVISCAGIGSRLGLSRTKALIEFNEKTLIELQLSWLLDINDIRIVVGFQYSDVIDAALKVRRDIVFVFNHDYFHNKTGASLYLGAKHANNYVIAWDGDLIVHPEDVAKCLIYDGEFVGCSSLISDDPVYVKVNNKNQVISFSLTEGDYEWSGPACISRDKIKYTDKNVFDQIREYLPLPALIIKARDIDTYDDYLNAKAFVEGWGDGK
ncbi:HAD-IB family phosphatase [Pectobacterium versatile]|uniref:HAD-IB family phosphatase n=1 Tax=Pectobacterium versatile TaxID=2488639 RepID=UPI000D1A8ED4|nr:MULTISPECIES: HAD-IB family phosphatase [Pectobacterium]AVT58265.1 haloacid dehalogenase-like hydrolase [Pectobacterium versatile]MCL6340459.1 hydrolase [Pectobacterium carotovorum subsp. carotovorum]MCL6344759.1 hydrolase [Pectobacterium carotovorum subsp. carotovorum]